MRRAAVSVDLDEIHHYFAIHGLGTPPERTAHAVYDLALERCFAFARELGIPLTLFVVAADLERPENVRALRRALELGHEIGNHSKDHLYDLTRRSPEEQREQVGGALALFESHLGIRPKGFRAPGYTVSDHLLRIVAEAGHSYDSSVFPCPAYYAAKAAALGMIKLRGRRSHSVLDHPSVLTAPTQPYRLGEPYTTPGGGMWEFPIQVTRGPRLPFIGTALTMAGRLGARVLTELVIQEPFANLELHGIDFLDESDAGLAGLRGYQPDVKVTWSTKRETLTRVIERMHRAAFAFSTLAGFTDVQLASN
ncbi:MAG: polysaccharide deacetylase family protein [Polyangiaceae bacterium]